MVFPSMWPLRVKNPSNMWLQWTSGFKLGGCNAEDLWSLSLTLGLHRESVINASNVDSQRPTKQLFVTFRLIFVE